MDMVCSGKTGTTSIEILVKKDQISEIVPLIGLKALINSTIADLDLLYISL